MFTKLIVIHKIVCLKNLLKLITSFSQSHLIVIIASINV